jgi:hypothetical protein
MEGQGMDWKGMDGNGIKGQRRARTSKEGKGTGRKRKIH